MRSTVQSIVATLFRVPRRTAPLVRIRVRFAWSVPPRTPRTDSHSPKPVTSARSAGPWTRRSRIAAATSLRVSQRTRCPPVGRHVGRVPAGSRHRRGSVEARRRSRDPRTQASVGRSSPAGSCRAARAGRSSSRWRGRRPWARGRSRGPTRSHRRSPAATLRRPPRPGSPRLPRRARTTAGTPGERPARSFRTPHRSSATGQTAAQVDGRHACDPSRGRFRIIAQRRARTRRLDRRARPLPIGIFDHVTQRIRRGDAGRGRAGRHRRRCRLTSWDSCVGRSRRAPSSTRSRSARSSHAMAVRPSSSSAQT